jgi:hypothetical protein
VRRAILICLMFLLFLNISGQTDTLRNKNDTVPGRLYLLQKVTRNGITLPEVDIKEVTIIGYPHGSTQMSTLQFRKYDRLVYNLKRVYPYSLIVREKLGEVNKELSELSDDRERRRYIKDVEKEVFGKYEDDIKQLTITQGHLLLKLIDRETQNTSYELIKQYRGGLSAAFWQGIARIFGTNLKEEFDPYGNDIVIEFIIQEIEAGRL